MHREIPGLHLQSQCKTLWLLLLLLLLPAASAASAPEAAAVTEQPCVAHWSVLSSQGNRPGGRDFHVRLAYSSGPRDPQPVAGSPEAQLQEDEARDPTTLVAVTVRLAATEDARYHRPRQAAADDDPMVQLTGAELAVPVERSLTVTVPERGSVTVWQLVATVGGDVSAATSDFGQQQRRRRFGFENTAVTSGSLEPPTTRVVGCSASFRTRALIGEDTPVRLRHAATGRHLVMTRRRGWEAATLGYSREFRFRLRGVGMSGGIVRIEAETHLYGGHKFAYSSLLGGVYFDVLKLGSESQQWSLSDPYPRDGAVVVIRSVRWPAAALVRHPGDKTASVFCLNTQTPERWIIEAA